jgi:hypothetical protein
LIWSIPSDNDTVTLAHQLVITQQSIGDALEYAGFPDVDGIIGFGPADITEGSLPADPYAIFPTIMNNAVEQKLLKNQILGVSFAPATSLNDTSMCACSIVSFHVILLID